MRVVMSFLVAILAMAFVSSMSASHARASLDLQDFDGRYARVDGDHLTIIPLAGSDFVDKAYIAGSFTEKQGSCHLAALGNWHYDTKVFTINAGDGCHLQLLVDAQAFRFSEGPSGRCSERLCNGGLNWDFVKMGRNTLGASGHHAMTPSHRVQIQPVIREPPTHELRVEIQQTTEYRGFWATLGSAVGSVLDFLAPVGRIERTTTIARATYNQAEVDSVEIPEEDSVALAPVVEEKKAIEEEPMVHASHPSEFKKRHHRNVHVQVEIDA